MEQWGEMRVEYEEKNSEMRAGHGRVSRYGAGHKTMRKYGNGHETVMRGGNRA